MTEQNEKKDDFIELLKAIAVAGAIALFVRSFFIEPFNIPSGSLLPTLQIGDHLFVKKYAYGYSRYSFPLGLAPFRGRIYESTVTRGDIAVFRQPGNESVDYIKRIVGIAGDRIQVKDGILYINGEAATRAFQGQDVIDDDGHTIIYQKYIETMPGGPRHMIYEISDQDNLDNTPEYIVPPGHYFAMGDNRDRSQDSRVQNVVGFVPAENLVGKAWFIFFSIRDTSAECRQDMLPLRMACRVLKWPFAIRYDRLLKPIKSL